MLNKEIMFLLLDVLLSHLSRSVLSSSISKGNNKATCRKAENKEGLGPHACLFFSFTNSAITQTWWGRGHSQAGASHRRYSWNFLHACFVVSSSVVVRHQSLARAVKAWKSYTNCWLHFSWAKRNVLKFLKGKSCPGFYVTRETNPEWITGKTG